ncbi:MAG: response regulator [bacterium]|jgi:CheY-like chemotaxis protein|nr:response regulator [bacterium]
MARILIIDDDKQIRVALRHLLQSNGHVVEEAINGEEGLASFQSQPADLVLLDILMPGISGLEVIGKLQEHTANVSIVTLSSAHKVGRANLLSASVLLGAVRSLQKPYDPVHLIGVIDELLATR